MQDKEDILPSELLEIMKSPQMESIMETLRQSGAFSGKEAEGENAPQTADASAGGLNLPPDFAQKLPAIISALSGMGLGQPQKNEGRKSGGQNGNEQRKALLKALKPYLSPKRRSVVESMLGLESLSGLLGVMGNSGKEDS